MKSNKIDVCVSGGPDSEQSEETGSEEAHAAAHSGDAFKEVSVSSSCGRSTSL